MYNLGEDFSKKIAVDVEIIQKALDKRRPGAPSPDGSANSAVTKRVEPDSVEILSGGFNDKSEGTPIALFIRNTSQHSSDYNNLKDVFRPGHADFTFDAKYKGFRDYRGGGRSSGRETAARVAAGAVANQILIQKGIKITAYTTKVIERNQYYGRSWNDGKTYHDRIGL